MEKIEKLRILARNYYSRKDIQKALVGQAKNKEIAPRYFDNFGKRPDSVEYEQDILALAEKGATSFHCSEELWQNPLEISTKLNTMQINKLRKGWDLLLDIDCKFIEYGKIAAWLICEALYFHNIKNFGLKFSGGSGFHIGLAFEAFPAQLNDIKVKNFFPEGPRLIADYLKDMIMNDLSSRILEKSTVEEIAKSLDKKPNDLKKKICKKCGESAVKRIKTILKCKCGRIEEKIGRQDIQQLCPDCGKSMQKKSEAESFECQRCGNTEDFKTKEEFNPFSILEIDTILLAPRHLYRMAYSLHEKTGLASIVIRPEQIKAFHPAWARPDRIFPVKFLPEPEKEEAKELLIQAIDWKTRKEKENEIIKTKQKGSEFKKERQYDPEKNFVKITEIKEEMLPPCIKEILRGIKNDGRKRALFILINFFRSLGLDFEEVEKRLSEWNKLNYQPLKENYIKTQLQWFKKQKTRMPPNCSLDSYYPDMQICKPDFFCRKIKNPVRYVILKAKITKKEKGKRKTAKSGKKTKVF